MNWRTLMPLVIAPICIACFDGKDDDDEGHADSGYTGGATSMCTATGPPTTATSGGYVTPLASVTWNSSSIDVVVSGGPGGYWFGMAETWDCDECWTGEDCVYGYDAGGTTLSYCHDAGDTGTSLAYGGDPGGLAEGTTVFTSASFSGSTTYFLESDPDFGGNGACFMWGHDPRYYDGLGCTEL